MESRKRALKLYTYAFLFVVFVVVPLFLLGAHYQLGFLIQIAGVLFAIACFVSFFAIVKSWIAWIKEMF
ncbi:hypothetical protein [Acinetobacter venetianus]|uniref:Uncharacterized protein n=1 Tax=Acinetobacter venetianus (strain ATCC 31012 / DSM 23050 / BCRC 14357 / CCUG 45561 / CIP 110063 / KCTC 2702 / LMG 19082 / RAG-1) TaxID=1191460 RepID=N8ZZ44_ACIVR|nr:hypothetical protein [Acinetobacter venetianus]MDA0696896.1 hypothetical protein [Pseudomonadota bacterium]ENV36800.1 hypothetical protein F959_02351 [Acinetobacter venetianus RAG-1 = CIP 110063]KXZ67397.1 hypothetical protein AVENLUH7437_00285 [Acinetobacter venetianus]MCR4532797.1 hypothetical protein [Acinetobacter venetianus]MDA1255129.1 hypothetical protein [Pseudomonadota bacterium]